MRRMIPCLSKISLMAIFVCLPVTASAQSGDGMIIIAAILQQLHKVADLSVGFSMANATASAGGEGVVPLGLQFGTAIGGPRPFSFEADLAVQSGTPGGQDETFNMFEYLFGPRFSRQKGRAEFFCHALIGGVHHWQGGAAYEPATLEGGGFAMAYGGGVELYAGKGMAIRILQIDWLPFRDDGSWRTDTTRFEFGIVFKAGDLRGAGPR